VRTARVERGGFVLAVGAQDHRAAHARGEQQHAHDALGIDLAAVAQQERLGTEAREHLHEFGRRARMQAELVGDEDLALEHGGGSVPWVHDHDCAGLGFRISVASDLDGSDFKGGARFLISSFRRSPG
jgi:hypothetical protein